MTNLWRDTNACRRARQFRVVSLTRGGCSSSILNVGHSIVEDAMAWRKPRIVEIAVGLEINSYACARVK